MAPPAQAVSDAADLAKARGLDAEAMALLGDLPSAEGDGTRGPLRAAAARLAKEGGHRPALALFAQADALYWRVVLRHDSRWAAIARRTLYRSADEAHQEARIGAREGAIRWDPAGGSTVPAYLAWWARAWITRWAAAPMVKMSHNARWDAIALDRTLAKLPEATDAEIGERHGWSAARVATTRQAHRAMFEDSLDRPASQDDDRMLVIDLLASESPSVDEVIDARRAAEVAPKLLATLPERQAEILRARHGFDDDPKTLKEIGVGLGLSRERVRQIEGDAITSLRKHLEAPMVAPAPPPLPPRWAAALADPAPAIRVAARAAPKPDGLPVACCDAMPPVATLDGSEPLLLARPWYQAGRDRWHRRSFGGRVLVTAREWLDAADWTPTFGDQSERTCSTLPAALAEADAHLRANGWTLDGDTPGERPSAADSAHLEAVRRPPDAPDTGSTWWPGSPLGGPDVRGVRASRWKLLGGLGGKGWGEKGWRRCLGTRQIVAVRIHEDRAVWLSHLGPECFELNGGTSILHTFPFGEDARAAVRSAFADADAYLVRLGMVLTGEPPDVNALLAGHIDAEPAGVVDEIVAALPAPAPIAPAAPIAPTTPTPAAPVLDIGAELRARLAAVHAANALPSGDGWAQVDLRGSDGNVEYSLADGDPLFDEVKAAIGAIIARRRAELLARAGRGIL